MKIDPPAFLSDPAAIRVLDALPEARIVGGAVRDALAGRPVADIDLATPLLPAEVAAALAEAGIRSVPTGLDHGTLTAVVAGRGFQITTLRRDVATDGRRAVVAYTTDWREDAARRDFTINAMSMTREGTVADYFGGAGDLAPAWFALLVTPPHASPRTICASSASSGFSRGTGPAHPIPPRWRPFAGE